ncbi:hypothetical protein [Micromonospora sp. WMMD708]|uniref:hypothetical protein n=1 Tax=Micromonospora sp. WMMD708 TaxID=3403464 RepID=UPI003BF596B9
MSVRAGQVADSAVRVVQLTHTYGSGPQAVTALAGVDADFRHGTFPAVMALAMRPEVIFCDQPTGALDTQTAADVLTLLRSVVDDSQQTVIMVTHGPVAASYGDRVMVLADGRIVRNMARPGAEQIAEQLAWLGRRQLVTRRAESC